MTTQTVALETGFASRSSPFMVLFPQAPNNYWDTLSQAEKLDCIDTNNLVPIPGKSAWEVRGPLQHRWENDLLGPIYCHLNRNVDKTSKQPIGSQSYYHERPLHLDLCMVGTLEAFRPTVVVFCHDHATATRALRLIKSYLAEESLGFAYLLVRSQITLPMDAARLSPPQGGQFEEHAKGHSRGLRIRDTDADVLHVQSTEPRNISGLHIEIKTTAGRTFRTTIGGCLQVDGKAYAMTALHGLHRCPPPEGRIPLRSEDAQSQEWDFLTDSASSPSNSETENAPSRDGFLKRRLETDDVLSWGVVAPSLPLQSSTGEIPQSTASPLIDLELDLMLLPLETEEQRFCNRVKIRDHEINISYKAESTQGRAVFIIGDFNGIQPAILTPILGGIFMPQSGLTVRTWTIRHEVGVVTPGDCGSWIVDKDGRLYGHLVATEQAMGRSYIVPFGLTMTALRFEHSSVLLPVSESKTDLTSLLGAPLSSSTGINILTDWKKPSTGSPYRRVEVGGTEYTQSQNEPRFLRALAGRFMPQHELAAQLPDTSVGFTDRVEPMLSRRYEVERRGQQQRQSSDARENFSLFPRNLPIQRPGETDERNRVVRSEIRRVRLGDAGNTTEPRTANPRDSVRRPDDRTLQHNDVRPDSGARRSSAALVDLPTASTPAKRSVLSDLAERFVLIPAGNFPECGDFLDRHPSILGHDCNLFLTEAIEAQKAGNTSRARSCVQRSIILRKCRNMRATQLNTFIAQLFAKDRLLLQELFDHFDITIYEVTRKAAPVETQSQNASASSRESRTNHSNTATRTRHSEANPGTGTDTTLERRNDRGGREAKITRDARGQIADHGVVQRSTEHGQDVIRIPQSGNVNRDPIAPTGDSGQLPMSLRDLTLNTPLELSQNQRETDEESTASTLSVLPGQADFRAREQPDEVALDSRYSVRSDGGRFFVRGRVFQLLWHENAASDSRIGRRNEQGRTSTGNYRGQAYSKPRRFIVVRQRYAYCWCIPIETYGNRGVVMPGIEKNKRAREAYSVVHGSGEEPCTSSEERDLMVKRPIKVDLKPGQRLEPMSRLNFGKVQSVEWNVKVMDIGMVSKDSEQRFADYWRSELDYLTRET